MKKKFLFIAMLAISIVNLSCQKTPQELQEKINELQLNQKVIEKQNELADKKLQITLSKVDNLESKKNQLALDIEEKEKLLNIYNSGKVPKYIVKFHLKQSHLSLDIGQHIKDASNAIDFEMPVDKDYYNSISEGQNIVSNFRFGSAIINGSFGDWKVSVKSKRVE